MYYVLKKITDDMFNGHHPNLVLEGMEWIGHINSKPTIGDRFRIGTDKDHPRHHMLTSTVTDILVQSVNGSYEVLFKTENSTYRLTEIPIKE